VLQDGAWAAADQGSLSVRLACDDLTGWRLASVAGGRPAGLFGEWRRDAVRPVSVFADERLVPL
jgi:hypothetical protein